MQKGPVSSATLTYGSIREGLASVFNFGKSGDVVDEEEEQGRAVQQQGEGHQGVRC